MATVDLNDVKKVYAGGVEAVKGVSIAIPDKALCVLVGPSGCGKSTLLRMIAGLETISSGDVSIDGKVVNTIGPAERDIAMVFQNYALYPHMKVYDNMAYGLRNRGMPKDEIDRRVRETAKTLELAALLDRRPRELSGGQRQRVAIARAIVRRPAFVVADEPVSALDMTVQKQILKLIRGLQGRHGFACLFVSHDLGAVEQVADRVAVMENGRIVEVGRRDEVFDDPKHEYTKRLLDAAMLLDRKFVGCGFSRPPAPPSR